MAFNPFRTFRKHQKSFFAVMVIVCMFVFILSFGAGDLVSQMLNWFGGGKGRGPVVATLNGDKVHEPPDLSKLAFQRQMAANFFQKAFETSMRSQAQNQMQQQQALDRYIRVLTSFGEYGLPLGSNRPEALLDFMIWRKQADRLGITLTVTDVQRVVTRFTNMDVFGAKPFTTSLLVQAVLSQETKSSQRLSPDELLTAVTDELRVYLAQQAVFGISLEQPSLFGMPAGGSPPPVTPGEYLQYYREQRTTLNVWMLPVFVEDYLPKAKKEKPEPSEAVLKELFELYKGQLPDPNRDRPAFKEPERVKAEWISAGPDLKYFKDLARARVEVPAIGSTLQFAMSGFAGISTPGAAAPWATLAGAPVSFDRTLLLYADYVQKQLATVIFSPGSNKPEPHERSFSHPSQLGTIVGAFTAGASRSFSSLSEVWPAWAATVAITEMEEMNRLRTVQITQQFGSLFAPPLGGAVVPPLGPLYYQSPINSYSEMRDKFLDKLREYELTDPTNGVINTELTALSKKLTELKGKQEEADKLIKEAVEKFGLRQRHRAMTVALDKYSLEKDDKYGASDEEQSLKKVRTDFLEARGGGDASQFPSFLLTTLTGTYEPKDFRRLNGDTYLIWRTEYVPAREPKTLAEIRDTVVRAWYWREARRLARLQAEEWSAKAKLLKPKQSAEEIRKELREAGKSNGRDFELNGVARLVVPVVEGAAGRSYSPYKVEEAKIAHARPDLGDLLVKRLKEKGDSTVVSDQPEAIFYVAVLFERDNQTDLSEFLNVFSRADTKPPFPPDQLWNDNLMRAKRGEYQKMVIKQLRLDAGAKLKDNGDYELPDDLRLRGVGTAGDGE